MDSREPVIVVLPYPSSKLNAHNKGHWRNKSAVVKQYRTTAKLAASEHSTKSPIEQATISYRFFVPDNRRRDAANLIQMVKPGIDGIVDAGLIADDCWQKLTIGLVVVEIDRDNPRVELSIRS